MAGPQNTLQALDRTHGGAVLRRIEQLHAEGRTYAYIVDDLNTLFKAGVSPRSVRRFVRAMEDAKAEVTDA